MNINMVRNTSEHNLINIYQNTIEYEYINRFPKLRIRNIIKRNKELVDCGSCGGSGCGRCCCLNNPDIVDCGSCGGSGCGRCC